MKHQHSILFTTLMMTFLLKLFGCATPPPPPEKRFADEVPVGKFDIPKHTLTLPPYTKPEVLKSFAKSENIFPFTIYDHKAIFFLAKDEENLYVCMDENEALKKDEPEEAEKRKPYLGISAIDLKTKSIKWRIPHDDKETNANGEGGILSAGSPRIFGNNIIVFKSNYGAKPYGLVRNVCIIDKKTGKVIKTENGKEDKGFTDIENKYLVRQVSKKGIDLLNPKDGSTIFSYTMPEFAIKDGTEVFSLLSDELLYYYGSDTNKFRYDIMQETDGKIIETVEFDRKETGKIYMALKAIDENYLYFQASYCGTSGFDVRPADCESADLKFDRKSRKVVMRSEYYK